MAKRLMDAAPWLSALGVLIMLVGLGWDGVLHSQDPDLGAHEGIFTLTNPGHVLFALGLVVTVATAVYYLVGLAQSRYLNAPRARALSLLAALGLLTVAVGSMALTLGTQYAADEHKEASYHEQTLASTNQGAALQALGGGHAQNVAQVPEGTILAKRVSGCEFKPIDLSAYGMAPLQNPSEVTSVNGIVHVTLTMTYTDPNSTTIGPCPVNLRSYGGKLIGPTLRVKQGETIAINLQNQLPLNPPTPDHQDMNTPHDFNTTNLHTHGLHVSPTGNSDNVLLEIEPQTNFYVEIKVPPDHPVGTYWYHPHNHGSTAIQVSSSMEGALIIEPSDENRRKDTGAQKLYLEDVPQIKEATEQVLLFQQIPYNVAGQIETYNTDPFGYVEFGPCSWEWADSSKCPACTQPTYREHTINGQLYPTIRMAPGEVQRWRLIHGGVRESLSLELHGPNPLTDTTSITDVLKLPTHNLNEIAADGIALGRIDTWTQVMTKTGTPSETAGQQVGLQLAPGYRSDVLVQLDTPGIYYLVDGLSSAQSLTCNFGIARPELPSLLARVEVTGTAKKMDLPTSADLAATVPFTTLLTLDATQGITGDQNPLPAPSVTVDNVQKASLSVTAHSAANASFLAAEHPFSFDRVRTLQLDTIDEWVLETPSDSLYYAHPFHIHVNSFQTARFGPTGYPELVWKDTLLVPIGFPQYVYTRYADYIGQFVYHCHILDHEDQGMMEVLEVVLPPQPLPTSTATPPLPTSTATPQP
jgi:FtsP/CotA-like multicopper oxidase with cupredoxin domain